MSDKSLMHNTTNVPVFYQDKPTFGFDVGHGTLKVVQLTPDNKGSATVKGYGYVGFDSSAMDDNGVIVEPEIIANALQPLFKEMMIGEITTDRIVVSLPAARTFSRILTLPKLEKQDLAQAVQLEAEQYIPVPAEYLYIDYEITQLEGDDEQKQTEVLMVAAQKNLVDSYIHLANGLGLEIERLETNIMSISRAVMHAYPEKEPTLIVDFGSKTSDVAIFDKSVRLTSTIDAGGDTITELISDELKISMRQAHTLKSRYGIADSKWKDRVNKSINPTLEKLVAEFNKMIRYYKDRAKADQEITRIVILGGGANLPGLDVYLSEQMDMPVRICNPWDNIDIGTLQAPHKLETTLYTTAIGLALPNRGEL